MTAFSKPMNAFHALCCLQHFQVVERLIQNSAAAFVTQEMPSTRMPLCARQSLPEPWTCHQIGADRPQ